MGGVMKKRGRPAGSKNKPKVIRLTKAEVDLAKKVGVPVTAYAREKMRLSRKPRQPKVNWEKLAKQLQTALNDEIVEGINVQKRMDDLKYQVANLEHQAIGYRAVISYLENKIEYPTV